MSEVCPHCGTPVYQEGDICAKCEALFRGNAPLEAPSPLAPPPGEPFVAPPGWIPDAAPTAMPTPPRANGLAIASLVLGIVSFVICLPGVLTAIIGLVLGILALTRIANNPQGQGGKGAAIAGVILSPLALVLWLVAGMVMLAVYPRAQMSAYQTNQFLISHAVTKFTNDTGVAPRQLDDLNAPSGETLTYLPDTTTYHGPYLPDNAKLGSTRNGVGENDLPRNPFANGNLVEQHWKYDPETGEVSSAVPLPKVQPLRAPASRRM